MGDFIGDNPWLGWVIIAVIEGAALAAGLELWHLGKIAWYVVPVAPIVPPVVAVVAGVLGLANAESNGENPFQ